MFNPIDRLIGMGIYGEISEPWGFLFSDEENTFNGHIISIEIIRNNEKVLICKISKFELKDKEIDTVIAKVRGPSQRGICESLLAHERVTCSFAFKDNGMPIAAGEVADFLIENPTPRFMIGSLRLKP